MYSLALTVLKLRTLLRNVAQKEIINNMVTRLWLPQESKGRAQVPVLVPHEGEIHAHTGVRLRPWTISVMGTRSEIAWYA